MAKHWKTVSTAHINEVVWITSLRENEQGVTRRILDDLGDLFKSLKVNYEVHEPKTAAELLALLDNLEERARQGRRPLIHFDMHGGKKTGLHIVASGENIDWRSLAGRLRAINAATQNNLCVLSLACFGFYLAADTVSIDLPTPFFILAAPQETVTAGYVEDVVLPFYDQIFTKGDLGAAFRDVLGGKLTLFHSEALLYQSIGKYFKQYCMGKGRQQRVENLLSMARAQGAQMDEPQLKHFRKFIKDAIKPSQKVIDDKTQTFMMGKEIGFDLDDVLSQIAKAKKAK